MPSGASESSQQSERTKKQARWHRRLVQQRLRGWSPILHVKNAVYYFIAVGIFCLAVGIPILVASLNVVRYSVEYGMAPPFGNLDSNSQQQLIWSGGSAGVNISVDIQIQEYMAPPIWVVYEVDSVFQNYRRYVRSYDSKAMHDGLAEGAVGASACEPFQYITGEANASFPNSGAIQPCGQISQSLFNDTFTMTADRNGGGVRELPIDTSDIAWSSDANDLYGDVPPENFNTVPDWRGGGTFAQALNSAQAWMVWQRPSAKPAAAKLYGHIDTALHPGTVVSVTVANRYNSYAWQGKKRIIITTNSWVGGQNLFLGAFYIVVAGIAWALGGALFAAYSLGLVSRRGYGDLSQLSWVRRRSGTMRAGEAMRPARVSPASGVMVTAGSQGAQVPDAYRNRSGEQRVVPL